MVNSGKFCARQQSTSIAVNTHIYINPYSPFKSSIPKKIFQNNQFCYVFTAFLGVPGLTYKIALAEYQAGQEAEGGGGGENGNKRVVKTLYDALGSKDVDTVQRLLAPDLEWWFHGPPGHQHLKHLLTGSSSSFAFVPVYVVAFGSTVLAEGYNKAWSVTWVHAWTVTDGIITQVREYFNTSVTVITRFWNGDGDESPSPAVETERGLTCLSVWQSKLSDINSVPGLLLALQ